MPDNKNKKHPLDGKRIDINDPDEVRYWCSEFGVNENILKLAVKAVGTSSTAVRNYLNQ